jgi:hypothetical protein
VASDGSLHRRDLAAGRVGSNTLLLVAEPNRDASMSENLAVSAVGDMLYVGGNSPRLLLLADRDAMTSIRLPIPLSDAIGASFSQDGRWLFTSGHAYSLRAWHVRLEEAVRLACATAGRDVDDAERQMFGIDAAREGVCHPGR